MTHVLPNFFLEDATTKYTKIDELLCFNYTNKTKSDFISVRTVMHCMIIIIDGSKIIHLENSNINVNAGEICFLTQDNYFMSERLVANSNYKALIIYFDDKYIFDALLKYKITINTKEKNNIVKLNYKRNTLLNTNVQLFQDYINQELDTNLLKLKIEEIFLHSLRLNPNLFSSFINEITSKSQDRIKYILESNLDLIQTLSDMCKLTRLSEGQIRRYIKKEYNLTPKVWLDTRRFQKATLMLKNTNKTITDISTECGYATVSWFISQFKKKYNQTPKEFRQNM